MIFKFIYVAAAKIRRISGTSQAFQNIVSGIDIFSKILRINMLD